MVNSALGSHASDWTSNEVAGEPDVILKHLFHGPQADVAVEIYRVLQIPGFPDPLAYRAMLSVIATSVTEDLGAGPSPAEEERARREELQKEAEVQARAAAEARVRQNICLSDDLTAEWRNPPAGGKMEKLKEQLVVSLRERANTPSYDQTRWIVVNSTNYPAWNPGTSFGKVVSTRPGGSCVAGEHREILPLAP